MKDDLRKRVVAGLGPEITLFGSTTESGQVLKLPGVIASVSPTAPDRSFFNSVSAVDAGALAASLDELGATYERAGVRAWTVLVPDDDRESAALLSERGHVLDSAPRAMGLKLSALHPLAQPLPTGVDLAPAEIGELARINDLAYGIESGGWSSAAQCSPDVSFHGQMALLGGEPVSCAIVLDSGDDAYVTAVATVPEHQGRGLASGIVAGLLDAASTRGMRTATLRASKEGAPVYERLGFTDVGFIEMWELRQP